MEISTDGLKAMIQLTFRLLKVELQQPLITNQPTGRMYHTAVYAHDYIYVFGGMNDSFVFDELWIVYEGCSSNFHCNFISPSPCITPTCDG
jgi:hypothetical protein